MPKQEPGYLGYTVIHNEALQTGVHCGDIAIYIDSLRSDPRVLRAIKFIGDPTHEAGLIQAQIILYEAVKAKRHALCNFAIQQIESKDHDGQQSKISAVCCNFLSQEIETAIKVATANIELSGEYAVDDVRKLEQLWSVAKQHNPDITIEEFSKNPDICIAYINEYYNRSDNQNMFVVPQPGSTGMMDIAAMQLGREIIVMSARNGAPYRSKGQSYANYQNPNPVLIGYDGQGHFVELTTSSLNQLIDEYRLLPEVSDKFDQLVEVSSNESEQLPTISSEKLDQFKKLVLDSLIAIRITQDRDSHNDQLPELYANFQAAKILYADTVTQQESYNENFSSFIEEIAKLYPAIPSIKYRLVIDLRNGNNDAIYTMLNANAELQAMYAEGVKLYESLLKEHVTWLEQNPGVSLDSEAGRLQTQKLNQIILTEVAELEAGIEDTDKARVNSKLIDLIKIQAPKLLTINQNFATVKERLNQIKQATSEFTRDYVPPAPTAISSATSYNKYRTPSLLNLLTSFFSRIFSALLYPFKWLLSVVNESATPIPATSQLPLKSNKSIIYDDVEKYRKNTTQSELKDRIRMLLQDRLIQQFINSLEDSSDLAAQQDIMRRWNTIVAPLLQQTPDEAKFIENLEAYIASFYTNQNQTDEPYAEARRESVLHTYGKIDMEQKINHASEQLRHIRHNMV